MKTLIVCYSLTGHTQQLVDEVAALLNADVEVLQSSIKRGFFGYLKLAFDMLRKVDPTLGPVAHDPADYDMVVLAGPIWSGRMSSPIRIYAMQHKEHFTRTTLLCTSRSGEPGYPDRCMSSLIEATGIKPVAALGLSHRDIAGDHAQAVADFVAVLRGSDAKAQAHEGE